MREKNLFATILWPFYGLISTLNYWRYPWSKNVFWLVCVYLGAIQIYCPAGHVLGDGADGGRYALQLIDMHNRELGLFEQIHFNFAESGTMDYYQLILTWIVSLATDNPHVLFACFAFVFGFFYSRNMWYVLERISGSINITIFIFISLLFLTCPIWQINGVRMWTAAHIYMYSVFPYIWEGDRKRLIWLFAVPFVHFSYLYFVILSLVFVLLPYRVLSENKIVTYCLSILLVLSFIVGTLQLPAITVFLENFSPESYQDRIDIYTADHAFDNMRESRMKVNWYVTASNNIYYWVSNILLLLLSFNSKLVPQERKLLNFCLLISGIANIASQVPSGARFLIIAHLFTISLIIWQLYKKASPFFFRIAKLTSIPLIITIIFSVRTGLDFYGISMIVGNFFTSLIWDNNIPIINFIK